MLKGYDRLYGLEFLELSDTEVRARVPVRDELKQAGWDSPRRRVRVARRVDHLAGHRVCVVVPEGDMATGLSNSTNFLRPITEGAVHALATRLHRGRTTWVWDVRFSDDADRTCAVTRMTIAVRPLPERQAQIGELSRRARRLLRRIGGRVDRSARARGGEGIWPGRGIAAKPVSGSWAGSAPAAHRSR